MSSRRVKKGPGRRPQSAKRQRFMELRSRGWSIGLPAPGRLALAEALGRPPHNLQASHAVIGSRWVLAGR